MSIKPYEREAIVLLCSGHLEHSVLYDALNYPEHIVLKFFGAGYYLEVIHKSLPESRMILESPTVFGNYQGIEIGFIVFIENGTLCLECYNYGSKGIPEEIRCGSVQVSST